MEKNEKNQVFKKASILALSLLMLTSGLFRYIVVAETTELEAQEYSLLDLFATGYLEVEDVEITDLLAAGMIDELSPVPLDTENIAIYNVVTGV